MFKITISLSGGYVTGLEALEKRRLLGLPDGVGLSVAGRVVTGCHEPSCDVDEHFARTWFGRSQASSDADIPVRLVQSGDVKAIGTNAMTFADITPERIRELYVAARIQGIMGENERLKQKLAALESNQDDDSDGE
jgi:hypothetical protein